MVHNYFIFFLLIPIFSKISIDNLVKYTPYKHEANILLSRIHQEIEKFNQTEFVSKSIPGYIYDFKIDHIIASSIKFEKKLTFSILPKKENNTVCYELTNPANITFNLDWSYVTFLSVKTSGKAILSLNITHLSSCVSYIINPNGAPSKTHNVSSSLDKENFTLNSSDFGRTNVKEYITEILLNGLLNNITNEISTISTNNLNFIEFEASNNFVVLNNVNLVLFEKKMQYEKKVLNYNFSYSDLGYLTNYNLNILNTNTTKLQNDYQSIFSDELDHPQFILNTNFLSWVSNVISEKKIKTEISANETIYTVEYFGIAIQGNINNNLLRTSG